MVPEVFITCPGNPGWIVSNRGTVLSELMKRGSWRPIGSIEEHGYHAMRTGAGKKFYAHRLVALAFLGEPPPGKYLVRHLNGNKLDNRVENLAWGTDAENMADSVRLGVVKKRTHCRRGHVIADTRHRRCLICREAARKRAASTKLPDDSD